ncbi:sugar phosphate isomerase/epimerase family protein [Mucilaginibacter sp. AW1-3]
MSEINRKKFLRNAAILSGGLLLVRNNSWASIFASDSSQRYKVAIVDLMLIKRQKLGAFQLTKDIGADGLEVDMGGLGQRETFDSQLATPEIRKQFLDKAKELNLEICSLGMTGFYAQSFAERAGVERMVQDCIDTMVAMNVKVGFLPLGVADLVRKPELRPAVVERLKAIAPLAKKANVIIGIETSLAAADEVKLLDEIGSSHIQSYFNFANAADNGRDISTELQTLGKKRICQIHCSDTDGVWLRYDPKIDLKKIKGTLDKMKWSGWLVIERSRDANDVHNVKKNYSANTEYVKSVFQ